MAQAITRVEQKGKPVLAMTSIFGTLPSRGSALQVVDPYKDGLPAQPSCVRVDEKVAQEWEMGIIELYFEPAFHSHLLQSLGDKEAQLDGSLAGSSMWCALADHAPFDFTALAFVADSAFSSDWMTCISAWSAADGDVWDATISLTLHWHKPPAGEWLRITSSSPVISRDRHEMQVLMYDEAGELVATSTQLQTVQQIG
jgi:acyl-CoA thioesterase